MIPKVHLYSSQKSKEKTDNLYRAISSKVSLRISKEISHHFQEITLRSCKSPVQTLGPVWPPILIENLKQ